MKKKRSPISLNTLELTIGIGAGIATWFSLRYFLWSNSPFSYHEGEPLPLWFTDGRQELFDLTVIPMVAIMAISAIFLLRGIQNQDIKFSTRMSNLAIAYPLFGFVTVNTLGFFSLYCLPIGFIFAFVSYGDFIRRTESKWEGIAAIAWNVIWISVSFLYFNQLETLYGD